MTKTVGEMIREIHEEEDMEKKRTLTVNACVKSGAFRTVLKYYANPPVWFDDYVPELKLQEVPDGLGYTRLTQESKRLYIFEKSHPMSREKKEQQFITLMEGLDTTEATLVKELLTGSLNIDGLTVDNLKEWCPGLNLR